MWKIMKKRKMLKQNWIWFRLEMGLKKNFYEKRKVEGKSKLLSTLRFP